MVIFKNDLARLSSPCQCKLDYRCSGRSKTPPAIYASVLTYSFIDFILNIQTFRISPYEVKSLQNLVFKLTVFKNLKRNLNLLSTSNSLLSNYFTKQFVEIKDYIFLVSSFLTIK